MIALQPPRESYFGLPLSTVMLAKLLQATSAIDAAKAQLRLAEKGARPQEKKAAQNQVDIAQAQVDVTKKMLDRTTNLLDEGYNPGLIQKSVNSVINTAKGILSGKLDYGKNQTRIARLDKEFGSGYGQLIQDYINVLAGVRKAV